MGAWSLLSFGEDRHFQGNTGYADVLELMYLYDSSVPNSGRIAEGDLVFVRDKTSVRGLGWVRQIARETGAAKVRKRCPECRATGFKRRTTMSPRFFCPSCKHVFDRPDEEMITVTKYVANYAGTWRPLNGELSLSDLNGELSLSDLNGFAEKQGQQHSIRALKPDSVEQALRDLGVPPSPPEAAPVTKIDGGRRIALVSVRIGQQSFRQALLDKYGATCAMTGACPKEALEAAHLRAFAIHQRHEVEEGFLLRGDVHRLLDRGLLAVHPDTLEVHVSPRLDDYPTYRALRGRRLGVAPPSREALADHFSAAAAIWA
ncbi:HNH endonuclease [Umezawaea sp. NPDC059074]|uniref:HNH endonuclease n=1 Tax=Umezawaea sp. NPDC059074 TaxID=3346716 RepID=UPI003685EF57